MKEKIILGLSGGVDSFVAAILLIEKGFDVIGLTFELWKNPNKERILKTVEVLQIEHHFIDLKSIFKNNIVDNFIDDYLSAKTPNPCTLCNDVIKWEYLIDFANKNNVKYIATGHYVKKEIFNDNYYLVKNDDDLKDQSYFLWRLNQEKISRTIFPLAEYSKKQVKEIAKLYDFDIFLNQKESMSICFLENNNYRDFIINNTYKNHKSLQKGNVYDIYNNLIGTHNGIANYTIGQKSGMQIKANKKLAVSKINLNENSLLVDETLNLYTDSFYIENYNFVDIKDIKSDKISVLIRGLGINPKKFVYLEICENNLIKVKLQDKAWAVAPGQPAVFYIGNRLIGGGYIK